MIKDLENPKNGGESMKIPLEWKQGPLLNKKRRVTDKCCLIEFLLFLVFLIATSIYALAKSSHYDMTKLYDSSNNACGFDKAKDYPILLM